MNSLIKSATIIDKKSEFHNSKVDILIENNIITNIGIYWDSECNMLFKRLKNN